MRRTLLALSTATMLTGCFEANGEQASGLRHRDVATEAASADAPVVTAQAPVTNAAAGGGGTGGGTAGGGDASAPGAPTAPSEPGTPSEPTDLDEPAGDDEEPGQPATPSDPKEPARPASVAEDDAARFLMQASFGADRDGIEAVQAAGHAGWLAAQMRLPARSMQQRFARMPDPSRQNSHDLFWEFAIEGEDQLRQRVAFALSQIVVVSTMDEKFIHHPHAFVDYADLLQREAFGNYEDLIREVTLMPAMGLYLSHLGNEAADPEKGNAADENFARELMQLFTIGLEELTPGGEPTGRETYDYRDVAGLAKVFTGFSWADTTWKWPHVTAENRLKPMQGFAEHHDQTDKTFLGHTVPGGLTPEESVERALTHLLSHDNVGPFVTRQLIQRLVTANPSPAYVARVSAAYDAGRFEHDGQAFGTGRRGDMAAVTAAIYLDAEARSEAAASDAAYGKVRSPVLRFAHWARTFRDDRGVAAMPENTGRMRYSETSRLLGQRAFGAPSVFGYSRPGYVAPGTWSAGAGLAAPGLTHAAGSSMIGYMQHMANVVEGREDAVKTFFKPDYDAFLALADRPDALVDELALVLTADTMLPATRARITETISTIGLDEVNDPALRRVHVAVLMAVTTPEYAVQR